MVEVFYAWLGSLWAALWKDFDPFSDVLDIAVVAFAVYWLLIRIRGARAAQMLAGILVLLLVWLLSDLLDLATLGFLLDNFLSSGLLILIVIFQSDIRRALTRVGRGLFASARGHEAHSLEEIVRASESLSQNRFGALLVIERSVQLDDFVELGTPLGADLSRDLLVSIFVPTSPLHDGAVLVRDDKVVAAGCILPLTTRAGLPRSLGTRHRAALGLTEESDALAIVVSEETGSISLVSAGEIDEDLDGSGLRQALLRLAGYARGDDGAGGELRPGSAAAEPARG